MSNYFGWINDATRRLWERGDEIVDLIVAAYQLLVYVVEGREE